MLDSACAMSRKVCLIVWPRGRERKQRRIEAEMASIVRRRSRQRRGRTEKGGRNRFQQDSHDQCTCAWPARMKLKLKLELGLELGYGAT